MIHLADDLLNEYLDDALDAPAREEADTHLQACDLCRARLAQLQVLFSALDELPAPRLSRDLSPFVLMRLPRPRNRWSRYVITAQIGTALGVLFWVSMQLAPLASAFARGFAFTLPKFDAISAAASNLGALIRWNTSLQSIWIGLERAFSMQQTVLAVHDSLLHGVSLPSLATRHPTAFSGLPTDLIQSTIIGPVILAASIVAVVLCILANRVLLSSARGAQR